MTGGMYCDGILGGGILARDVQRAQLNNCPIIEK